MKTALLVLMDGTALITYTDELEYEPKVHCWKPHLISGKTKVVLSSWPVHTNDIHVLLNSSSLLTVCDPTPEVLSAYVKKVGQPPTNKKKEPVLLQEDENVPDGDEYEPDYIEE